MGNMTLIKEDTRVTWGWTEVEQLAQDLRYAARMLRKHWGFMLTTVITFPLGIGASTAIFSVIDGVLNEPLPYPQADRLLVLSAKDAAGRARVFSYPDFVDWKEQTRWASGCAESSLYNRDGDAIGSWSTRSLGNAVKDACEAIAKDRRKKT